MYKINEIVEALLYFAGSRDIKTKIVKACYLLESDYFNKTGKRLTDIEYKSYFYGPYSKAVITSIMSDENIFDLYIPLILPTLLPIPYRINVRRKTPSLLLLLLFIYI